MKRLLLSLCASLCVLFVQAQVDTVTIQQIQFVAQADLANCIDTSFYLNDTVVTYGTVVTPGGIAQAASGRNIWIQNGTGPFSGIDVFTVGTPATGDDILNLTEGDSVMIKGVIIRFGNETEIDPIDIQAVDFARPVRATPIQLSDLNNSTGINQLPTGEQWEGAYVEVYNVTVVQVDPFSGGSRVSFYVADDQGNRMNVSDRFLVQRLPPTGNFVAPPVGTVYDTLRGVIVHSANGCLGANGRGYEMFPYRAEDYVIGFSAPIISNITRNPSTPTGSQDVTVFATIADPDGQVVSASLYFAVGAANNNFLQLPMTNVGTTYSATIPNTAFSDGDIVKYYLTATDDSAATNTAPANGATQPFFFTVRDNGLTIYDVQYTPFENGASGYLSQQVTVEGIVTASAQTGDLGFVHIQQEGQTSWAGLQLVGGNNLASLRRGDKVRVTGTIEESFGLTRMAVLNDAVVLTTGNPLPAPVEVNPNDFTAYDFVKTEPYECMLVTLRNPAGGGVYVVDENADDPSNFAEYRVGSSLLDPLNGCRVIAGRVTNSAFSSLNFSYINDSTFIADAGVINVPVCIVTPGDTMASLSGIMTYTFGNMKLMPRNNDDVVAYSGANCATGITAIEQLPFAAQIEVYPNPASDLLHVGYSFDRPLTAQVRLYDMTGREVLRREVSGLEGRTDLQTGHLARGSYFLRIVAAGQPVTSRKLLLID
ncbi:MAG: hypothetical protein OHK0039_36250 [Bacteroidia bacterium]